MNDFYVYVVFRLSGEPCYVGKGRGDRWRKHIQRTHNQYLRRIIKKEDRNPPVVLVRENLSEAEAFGVERALITALGRLDLKTGCLVNHTDGGDGASNPSREARDRKSAANTEYWSIPKNREQAGLRATGRKHTEEAKQKIRIRLIGRFDMNVAGREASPIFRKGIPLPAEILEKMRASKTGVKMSAEARENMSRAQLGRKHSAETRAAMSRAGLGLKKRPRTEEEKRRLSAFVSSAKWWTTPDGNCYRAATKRAEGDRAGRGIEF
jgi:hypothetical protein